MSSADRPPRILIVDDERHNRDLLEVMLHAEGYLILTAAGGEEAVALAAQQPPDLILLDIMMPGMTGFHVVAELKANLTTRSIPVILITALDDLKANISRLSTGAEDLLTKPVNRVELCARVRNLLNLEATRGGDQ